MPNIVPVVLCGGSGTRLWPRSRATKPKPFLPLLGNKTLFKSTLSRCSDRTRFDAPVIVVGEHHMEFARPQANGVVDDAYFIVEPMGRNTAPAIALAAHRLDEDDIMLVCPSDHHIVDEAAFRQAAMAAAELAAEDWLVSFGIAATRPETGYGYIRRGEELVAGYRVASFVEKPDLQTAIRFLEEGDYAWNGGIFAFRAGRFLAELAQHRPEMADLAAKAIAQGSTEETAMRPQAAAFAAIEGESVDYAIMENTDRAAMVQADMGWSDIGNWDALLENRTQDEQGNVVLGNGEMIDAHGSMIDSDGPHVTIVGLENIVVIVDGDDVLVASRTAAQQVNQASRCKNQ